MSNLRWKAITILVVFIVFFGLGVYPLIAARYGIRSPNWLMDKQLKLGLDLKGGVHLVLRVETDDVLRIENEQSIERLAGELRPGGRRGANVAVMDGIHFRVDGVSPGQDAGFRVAANVVETNFARTSG